MSAGRRPRKVDLGHLVAGEGAGALCSRQLDPDRHQRVVLLDGGGPGWLSAMLLEKFTPPGPSTVDFKD